MGEVRILGHPPAVPSPTTSTSKTSSKGVSGARSPVREPENLFGERKQIDPGITGESVKPRLG